MILPDSRRKTCSTAVRSSLNPAPGWSVFEAADLVPRSLRRPGDLTDRAHFDAARRSAAGTGYFCRPLERFVQIRAFQNVIARQLFLGLGKRAIRDEHFAVLHADGGGGSGGLQGLGGAKNAVALGFFLHR